MTAQPQPIKDVEADVAEYLDLSERIEQLEAQRSTVKARLAARGEGVYPTLGGVTVTVGAPPRKFNLDRAWSMLTPGQQELCLSPDQAKVKKQLSGVLVDECMEPGTGANRVTVK